MVVSKGVFEVYKNVFNKYGLDTYEKYLKDFKKECYRCGNDFAVFEIRQVNTHKHDYLHKPTIVLCNDCLDALFNIDSLKDMEKSFVWQFHDILERG